MVTISRVQPGEEVKVCSMLRASFEKHVAPFYSKEGVKAFYKFADAKSMYKRQMDDSFVLLAKKGKIVLGVVEVRDWKHITMLFVIPHRKRSETAKLLIRRAEIICRARDPHLSHIDVFVSLYAISTYQELGFLSTGVPQCVDGVPFVPMCKPL